jgi:APA family basic amino acid/polyamine antiporter
VLQTGSLAILAFVVGDYATRLFPLGPLSSAAYAALSVVLLTALNVAGVRHGARAQNLLTVLEVAGVLLVVVAGLLVAPAAPAGGAGAGLPSASALGLVMVFVLLTYGGWNEAAYVSAELRDPRRNMAPALVTGIVVVTALYLLVNAAYLRALGVSGMAGSQAVAADLLQQAFGGRGGQLMSLLVALAAITSANATVITGARSAYALGRDFRPFAALGRWHPRTGTPVNALLAQGAVALALVGLGASTRSGFETMVEYTAPVFWTFFLLTGISLFVLRRRETHVPRGFRVPLYPLTPLLFCATCAYLLYASLAYTGVGALVGLAVLGSGGLLLLVVGPTSPGAAASAARDAHRARRNP